VPGCQRVDASSDRHGAPRTPVRAEEDQRTAIRSAAPERRAVGSVGQVGGRASRRRSLSGARRRSRGDGGRRVVGSFRAVVVHDGDDARAGRREGGRSGDGEAESSHRGGASAAEVTGKRLATLDRPLEPEQQRSARRRTADGERLGPAARAGERDGELPAQPFPPRMERYEVFELRYDVAVATEPKPRLHEVGPHLEVVTAGVGVQGRHQSLNGRARIPAMERIAALGGEPVEHLGVGHGHRRPTVAGVAGTIEVMADEPGNLEEQLQEIGTQLDWVRDYL
jgi:hypothetical protein